jgi:ParB-like chromosome segregation protein Spo0J
MAKSTFQIIKFADILPNPYRDLKANPLRADKIEALESSINSTDYWENAMVRPHPTKKGKYELVYGHTRVEAAKRTGLKAAGFIVREDISNSQMLLRMDQENRETWGNDICAVIESVKAVVLALAAGDIPDFNIDPSTNTEYICYAPSFVPGRPGPDSGPGSHPFTVTAVAQRLDRVRKATGKPNDEVVAAINTLFLIEVGQMNEQDLINPRTGEYKSVQQLLLDTRAIKNRHTQLIARAKEQRVEADKQREQIEAAITQEKNRVEKLQKEQEDIEKKYAAAQRDNIATEVHKQAERLKKAADEEAQRLSKVRDLQDKKKEVDKIEAKSRKEEVRLTETEEKRKIAAWESLCKTLVDRLNTVMAPEDGLYDQLIRWREHPKVTDAQRSAIALALRNASNRFAEFNPHKTSPSAKEQDAMKLLRSKSKKKGKRS